MTTSTPAKTIVYLLEDDPDISRLILRTLTQQGIDVVSFRRLSEFERAVRRMLPNLCLIDLSLPDGDGLSVVRDQMLPYTIPRVIVTGRGNITDRVVGLEVGADDYIVKPFEPRELVARIRAVLRRSRMNPTESPASATSPLIHFGDWSADQPPAQETAGLDQVPKCDPNGLWGGLCVCAARQCGQDPAPPIRR